MLLGAVVLAGGEARRRYRWLVFAVPAGLSWNVFMVQHTVAHQFSGMFGYFLWMLGVSAFFEEIYRSMQKQHAARAMTFVLLPVAIVALNQTYVPRMTRYVERIADAGKAGDSRKGVKKKKKKKRRQKGKQKKRGRTAVSPDDGVMTAAYSWPGRGDESRVARVACR
jgi:hypothetical protein